MIGQMASNYFKVGLIAGVCLMAAFYSYLQKTIVPTRIFKITYFAGLLMQTIVALTSYQSNDAFQWLHWTAAIILALVLVCAPWLFSASQNISSSAQRISEIINLLIFDLWILYLTFRPAKAGAI